MRIGHWPPFPDRGPRQTLRRRARAQDRRLEDRVPCEYAGKLHQSRGLRGVKLVISDAHEGLKAAVSKVLHASWQRCRVHFMRNVLAYAGKHGRRVVAAFIGTAFVQDDAEAARTQWRQVTDQLRPKVLKLAALMDDAEPTSWPS